MIQVRKLKSLDAGAIMAQAERVAEVLRQARDVMFDPHQSKRPPLFTAAQLSGFAGYTKNKFVARHRKGDLPQGAQEAGGRRYMFTVEEVRTWTRAIRVAQMRPSSAGALSIAIANFKGGVAKTTTAATLAQALSLRGHKVLLVDLDPQASLTTLFGLRPETDVAQDKTTLAVFSGDLDQIDSLVTQTYWPGIDLVPASVHLFGAEFELPARQMSDTAFQFWKVLDASMATVRVTYDVIIFDTPPALSYTTINALAAADGVLVPMPVDALSFASSAVFWELFGTLFEGFAKHGDRKQFAFIDIVPSQTKSHMTSSLVVREWMAAAYAEHVLPVDIPMSAAIETASKEFGAVYDMDKELTSTRTFKRVIEAYDRLADIVEQKMITFWEQSLHEAAPAHEEVAA